MGPGLVEISQPQLGLAQFSFLQVLGASAAAVEVFVIAGLVRIEAAHKVFVVVVVGVPLVVSQPGFSLSLSERILQPLQTWTVLPIAVDSFRR